MEISETVVAVTGIVATFGLPLLIVAVILYYKHRRLRLTHETIKLLADKGLPVPPELLRPQGQSNAGLRGGLVLVGLGLALMIFFGQMRGPWSIGLIPGLIGVALLIAWAIESRRER
jgi:hypothetical protein